MRLLMINPNTSQSFTDKIQAIASEYKQPTTELVVKTALSGPRSIESIYDEILSSPGTLECLIEEKDEFDGFIIACYSDHPVIYAMREITDKPVLGIAEASMIMACMLGSKFSVVTTNNEWKPLLWDAVHHYGFEKRCASIRTTGMGVLALEHSDSNSTTELIKAESKKAIEEDGAEVICLGCAGMAGLDKELEDEFGVPFIDGVVAALLLMEGLTRYNKRTSKVCAYSYPRRKEVIGLPKSFDAGYRNE
jgi:allantoin racemase